MANSVVEYPLYKEGNVEVKLVVTTYGGGNSGGFAGIGAKPAEENKETCRIPKPLYARTLGCNTVEELKKCWDDNKHWQTNKIFKSLTNRRKKELVG